MGQNNADKTCFSKRRYETEDEAWHVSDFLYETYNLDLGVYKCPICEGYHLTKRKDK